MQIYDICDLYMEHDEGLGLGNFSLDNAPLPHPFCRCTWYIDCSKSLEEIGQELGRWIAGERNPKLDGAFGEWKRTNGLQALQVPAIMKWKNATFRTEDLLDVHYNKHAKEFGAISKEDYIEQARSLLSAPEAEDVRQLERSDGSVSKYRLSTNEFVVGNEDGTIRTYFLPKERETYWKEELERNEKESMPDLRPNDT